MTTNPFKQKDKTNTLDFDFNKVDSPDFESNEVTKDDSLLHLDTELTNAKDVNTENTKNTKNTKEIIEDNNTENTIKPTTLNKIRAWFYKHRKLLMVLTTIALVVVVCFIIDLILNSVSLDTSTSGLNITYSKNSKGEKIPTEIPVRVLAYNADMGSSHELMYYVDTVAIANPGDDTMNITWHIPRVRAYKRSTYNEFCLLDKSEPNDTINNYCGWSIDGDIEPPANTDESTFSFSPSDDDGDVFSNRISCAYYIPSYSNGLVASLFGWNKLGDPQKIGCPGNSEDNWNSGSYLDSLYGFSIKNFAYVNGEAGNDASLSGLTMQNFFQSILSAYNSDINAGDIISNSFSDEFSYDYNTQVISLSRTGTPTGQSCDATSTYTIQRPAPVNGSDNSTTQVWRCIPIFTVDEWGRITGVSSASIDYDPVTGNEVVGVTGSNSGLVRSGSGTFIDPYTLAVALNSDGDGGLKIDSGGKLAIVAPECSAIQNPQTINPTNMNRLPSNDPDTSLNKLQWTSVGKNGKFTCAHDVDNQQLDMDITETTSNNTNGINTENTYTVTLSGDNASSIQFIDRNTNDQQISIENNNSNIGLNMIENYEVSLTGDNPSAIQFTDRDTRYTDGAGITLNTTDGSNIFSANVGKGAILLCPNGTTNCPETEKTIQVSIGGDDNTGFIGGVNNGGLEFNINGELQISAPTCGESQILNWDGSKFICINTVDNGTNWNVAASGTTGSYNVGDNDTVLFGDNTGDSGIAGSTNGLTTTRNGSNINYAINNTGVTAGSYNAESGSVSNGLSGATTRVSTIMVPNFTVNNQGQLTSVSRSEIFSVVADYSKGITINNNGVLELPGLNGSGTVSGGNCATGSGLKWTGSSFLCTAAYSYNWNLSANSTASAVISSGVTVNFAAGNGLTVAKSSGTNLETITYAVNLTGSRGIVINGGNIALPTCTTVGYVLKWNGTTYTCQPDRDTISDRCDSTAPTVVNTDSTRGNNVTIISQSGFTIGPIASIHVVMQWLPNKAWTPVTTSNRFLLNINSNSGCNFFPDQTVPLVATLAIYDGTSFDFTASTPGTLESGSTDIPATSGTPEVAGLIRLDEWADSGHSSDKRPINSGDKLVIDLMYLNTSIRL